MTRRKLAAAGLRHTTNTSGTGTSGGSSGYRGYEFQKEVTVWVALRLLFERQDCAEAVITVEPATQDDIEARLTVPVDKASATVTLHATQTITMQIKLRSTGHWSTSAFRQLVVGTDKDGSRGPRPRARPKDMLLADPNRQYVLLTNRSVDKSLSRACVPWPDSAPQKDFLPPGIAASQSESVALAGRFAVVENLTRQHLRADLRRQLESVARVPTTRIDQAIAGLMRAVEDRLLGLPAPLMRQGIEVILQSAGGLPKIDPQLSEYVPPAGAETARSILSRHNAVLLVGPAGYGKSLTAKQLAYERKTANPPFEIVRQSVGVGAVDDLLRAPGRHVFLFDDVWGQSKLEPDAEKWNSAIPRFLRLATPDKQFIIVSRSDIFRLAQNGVSDPFLDTITCELEDASYDQETRWQILSTKLRSGQSWQQDLAAEHRGWLLASLRSPLSLDRFAKMLARCSSPADANPDALISDAHIESIKRIVADQVQGWPEQGVACATVVWALARRGRTLKLRHLSAVRRELERGSPSLELDLETFVEWFTAQALAEETGSSLAVHGKVVEALESIITLHPQQAERTLERLARAFARLGESDDSYQDGLIGVVSASRDLASKDILLAPDVVALADGVLIRRLADADSSSFASAFYQVAYNASSATPLARFVKYLLDGAPSVGSEDNFSLGFKWNPPRVTALEIAAIQSQAHAQRVAAHFVSKVLPVQHSEYDAAALLSWLKPFGFALDAEFLKGCEVMASEARYRVNADTIVECALDGPDPPYGVVFDQIVALGQRISDKHPAESNDRALWQGEMDYAEQLHRQDEREDDMFAVSHAAEGYVRARCRRQGYAWINQHPSTEFIQSVWAELIALRSPHEETSVAELDAFFTSVAAEYPRACVLRAIGEHQIWAGRGYMITALESGSAEERKAAVHALCWLEDDRAIEDELVAAMGKTDASGQVELALAAADGGRWTREKILQRLARRAPSESRDLLELLVLDERDVPLTQLLETLRRLPVPQVEAVISGGPRPFARYLLRLSAQVGRRIDPIAEAWLTSDDESDVLAAVDALDRLDTAETRERIADLISHKHYKVRRIALRTIAERAQGTEIERILDRANDPSAPVRQEVARLIGQYLWVQGLQTLLVLLEDTRDFSSYPEPAVYARDEYNFAVAREAASALRNFDRLPDYVIDALFTFVQDGSASSVDVELHAMILRVLARTGDKRVVAVFCRLLSDDRVIGGADENLYPVRYAAAWGLVHHLSQHVGGCEDVDWTTVEWAAGHVDAQLAGPALCLLGIRFVASREEVSPGALSVLRASHTTEVRRVLALIAGESVEAAREIASRYGLLRANHPVLAQDNAAETRVSSGWPITPALEAWLRKLKPERDVEGVVLSFMSVSAGLQLGVEGFDPTALRRIQRIQTVTLPELFGFE